MVLPSTNSSGVILGYFLRKSIISINYVTRITSFRVLFTIYENNFHRSYREFTGAIPVQSKPVF